MDFLQAIILGVIEGITEFLPVSSTGHLILASNFLRIEQTEFVKTFEIAIQSGAVLSVVFLYGKTILKDIELIKRVLIAFIPTAIIGLTLYKFIKQYLIGNAEIVLLSLFLGGIVLIAVELLLKVRGERTERSEGARLQAKRTGVDAEATGPRALTYERAFVIGLFQSVAMIPGVSRAAATIIGGMLVGLPRKTAVEFSFLLAIPTMVAATGLDLIKTDLSLWTDSNLVTLLIGFVISFLTAYIVVKWLIKFVQNHNFNIFGWYRIILASLFFVFYL